jgi:hypothetical protein
VRSTDDFIDSATQTAIVIFVFFTPDSGLTSVLTWATKFMENAAGGGSITVEHYEILEGSELNSYLAVQIIVLFFVILIVIDSFHEIKKMVMCVCAGVCVRVCVTYSYVDICTDTNMHAYMHARTHTLILTHSHTPHIQRQVFVSTKTYQWTKALKIVIDLATCASTLAFVVMRIPTKTVSSKEASRLVGSISQLQWESTSLTLNQKTEEFFKGLSEMLQLIKTDSYLDSFCSVILFASLVRVIQCTALHPRLALLTGTLGHALDDLWWVVYCVLLCSPFVWL